MLERLWIKGNHPTLLMGVENWRFLKKLKMVLSYDSEIPFLSIYPYKIMIRKDTCTAVFMKRESQSCPTLQPSGLYTPWDSPGQKTGVDSHSLLQGIFPTQGLNPGLPHCRRILYQLSHQGSPKILECVAHPFSSGFSQPRNRTVVSCTACRFFTT